MWNVREPSTVKMPRPSRIRQPLGAPPRPPIRPRLHFGSAALTAGLVVLGGLLHATPVQAIELGDGEFQGSLDTTISHGMTFRVEKRNSTLAADTNGNDGDLNYNRGIVSNTSKFTTDLDVGTGDFGAFVRATGFIDFENENGTRERTELSDAAKDRVGKNLELLDAYVTGTFDAGDAIVDMRLGRHVLNWGESTFIPNGINAINHFDVSKLRLPGSELREALLPVGLASLSVSPTDTLSMEGFYQLDWEETEIDPVGSYFSSIDYVGPGAREAVITDVVERLLPDEPLKWDQGFGFGDLTPFINCDLGAIAELPATLGGSPCPASQSAPLPEQSAFDPDFASVLRGPDRTPEDSGQWGLAMRYLAEDLNDTEFGFYFLNYHSRLPTVGAQTASQQGLQEALAAARAVSSNPATATAIASAVRPRVQEAVQAAAQAKIQAAVQAEVQPAIDAGSITQEVAKNIIRMKVTEKLRELVTEQVTELVTEQVGGIAPVLAIDRYAKSGHYFLEYPEDIQLFGVSFNTVLGASGWALQGEYSFRRDAPLQRAERVVLAEGLDPIVTGLGLLGAAGEAQAAAVTAGEAAMKAAAKAKAAATEAETASTPETMAAAEKAGADAKIAGAAATRAVAAAKQAGGDYAAFLDGYNPGPVQGYIERDVSQIQATATKVFGPTMGADALVFVTEAALMHVHDMPDKNTAPLESPAGGTLATGKADADGTSWGYRVAARLDYNNAIGGANLYPYTQFLHDVSGNSPSPSGPFVEGRTALTIGVRASYLSRWEADIGYTRYAGDGNELSDRDFISASVKYSF